MGADHVLHNCTAIPAGPLDCAGTLRKEVMSITPLQHVALLETFNIAVARAALSLSRLINEKISLSVPQLELLPVKELIDEHLPRLSEERMATVTQHFEGDLDTRALLLFPQSHVFEIVRLAVGGLVGEEDLAELEQETIAEVGNILLHACMSTLSSQLRFDLKSAPPAYLLAKPAQIFASQADGSHIWVLMIHIELTIESRNISACIAFMLDAHSNAVLLDAIDRSLSSMMQFGSDADTQIRAHGHEATLNS